MRTFLRALSFPLVNTGFPNPVDREPFALSSTVFNGFGALSVMARATQESRGRRNITNQDR
jgi:hypothetical protein